MTINQSVLTAVIGMMSSMVHADLSGLGAPDPSNGFPTYYQDFGNPKLSNPINPIALELCLPSPEELADKSCLLETEDLPHPNKAINFPNNFPHESFYYYAYAEPELTGVASATGTADLRMVLEATLSGDSSNETSNVQTVFSRLRYKFLPPISGNYTIETPYSIDGPIHYFASDKREVKVTVDIGLNCATGDFSCALKGLTTPFLRASDTEGGVPAPLYQAHGNTYLAPPDEDVFVTGGPKGNKFRITVIPDGQTTPITLVNTNRFQLMGRVYKGSAPLASSSLPTPSVAPAPETSSSPLLPTVTVSRPNISISAADPLASEASGDTGKFMINLSAPSANAITIKYKLNGKAKNGKDYRKLASTMSIPAGSVVGAIDVVPFNDAKREYMEKLTIQLLKKKTKHYTVQGRATASIAILDDD